MRVFLLGGLGNQLFQTSFAIGLASNCKSSIILDGTTVNNHSVRMNSLSLPESLTVQSFKSRSLSFHRLASRGLIPFILNEEETQRRIGNGKNFNSYQGVYGYFQSARYFEGHEKSIEKLFETVQTYPTFRARSQDIAIHIRGGDYLTNPKYVSLAPEYYSNALKMIQEQGDLKVVVYSDDINYAKWVMGKVSRNIGKDFECTFPKSSENELDDLLSMAASEHIIVANSTFSWWSAWLASRLQAKIYRPRDYFHDKPVKSDFYPSGWITVDG